MKICRNFVIAPGDCVILLQITRRGLTFGKLDTNQSTQAGLLKVNHQPLLLVEVGLNQRPYILYSLNQMILFLFMPLIKIRLDHGYCRENCFKLVLKEIQKQRKSSGIKGVKLLQDNPSACSWVRVLGFLFAFHQVPRYVLGICNVESTRKKVQVISSTKYFDSLY